MRAIAALALTWALVVTGLAQTPAPAAPGAATPCPRCGWLPPAAKRTVVVRTVGELEQAVRGAREGDEILLADGRYSLQRTIEISVPGVTLRSQSGDRTRVILHGRGMTGDTVGVAVAAGASRVTIADVTIRSVGFHPVQVRGENGASNFTLHNAVLEDAGQQLLKAGISDNGKYSADGLVACSTFSFTTHAPSDYTNGVDILGTKRWVVRDNSFARIRGPQNSAGPAILAWYGSEDTVVERNIVVDSFRGIALGLRDRHTGLEYDHLRGIIRNNIIVNLNPWADEGIEANGARGARILHNTVLVRGRLPWSIGVRFPTTTADVRNNLTVMGIRSRDGGVMVAEAGNVSGATMAWFVNAPADLRLTPAGARAVDAGVAVEDVLQDFNRAPRVAGRAPDAGAIEMASSR